MKPTQKSFLKETIKHIDIKKHNVVPLVEDMANMAYTSRDLNRAAVIYDKMLKDRKCCIFVCIAGSLVSAGLKKMIVDMIQNK
ncbi:MAG: deoxyhypusine synthase family protein, partial [Elusimicrobiaceae bacterium]|nr:deoxyhypusine synthase family protein [Elusimicrobiaceae bacterium]